MPLNAGGNLSIVASSDLGGLGARDGAPLSYNWVLPGAAPLLLPWFVILALLVLKPNRRAGAWLIWLPLGCVLAVSQAFPPLLPSGSEFFLDATAALAIGLSAVWLLSDYLRRQNRFVTFLCVLLALAGFSLLAAVAKPGGDFPSAESFFSNIVLAFAVLASAVALCLSGLICRGRYRPLGLYACLLLLLWGVWLLMATPFFVGDEVTSGNTLPWSQFVIPVLAVASANFVTLLPFLILSSASPLFRERLKSLLYMKPVVPPVMPPPLEATLIT